MVSSLVHASPSTVLAASPRLVNRGATGACATCGPNNLAARDAHCVRESLGSLSLVIRLRLTYLEIPMIRDILIGVASLVGAMEGVALAKTLKSTREIEATSDTPVVDSFRSGVATGAIIAGCAVAWPITAPMAAYRAYTHRDDIKEYAQTQIDKIKIAAAERRILLAEKAERKAAAAAAQAKSHVREVKAAAA